MGVLILHYGAIGNTPYAEWLHDYAGDIVLLASQQHLQRTGEPIPTEGYAYAEAVPGYETGGAVEARVLDLARRYDFDHVVAMQERDLERAAQLRDMLGLPGQRMDSVVPFRNKVVMKDAVSSAGVRVPAYRPVECATDIVAFVAEHGLPVVVKPRDSSGSMGLETLETIEDLDAYLAGVDELLAGRSNLMIEEFVPGSMCHVDGLVIDGRLVFAWPSHYLFRLASFRTDRGGRKDVTLDPDDPLGVRLLEFTDRVLAALPSPRTFAFHAEVFLRPDGELVLCEIACRTGGAAIRPIMRTMYGIDPNQWWLRASLGLPLPLDDDAELPLTPRTMAGQLVLVKRPGKVVEVPEKPPFPWVERTSVLIKPGQVMKEPTYSADFLASFVVSAPERAETERRMNELSSWFLENLKLEAV
jgi:biotin carboxylase